MVCKNVCFFRKIVICRICGKETKMPLLEKHSDLCREKEEIKKEFKAIDEELFKLYTKSEKTKKHLNIKIYLVKYYYLLFIKQVIFILYLFKYYQ